MTSEMIGLCITIAVLIGIGLIRIGADVTYRGGETAVKARIAGIPITVLPHEKSRRPKKKKAKKKTDQQKDGKKKSSDTEEKKRRKLSLPVIRLYLTLAKNILLLFKKRFPVLWKSFRIPKLYVYLCVATPDAAETAIKYGKLCGYLSAAYPIYREAIKIDKHDVTVDVDFCADSMYAEGEVQLRLTVGAVVIFVLAMAFGALWQYIKMDFKKKKLEQIEDKAVQVNE